MRPTNMYQQHAICSSLNVRVFHGKGGERDRERTEWVEHGYVGCACLMREGPLSHDCTVRDAVLCEWIFVHCSTPERTDRACRRASFYAVSLRRLRKSFACECVIKYAVLYK